MSEELEPILMGFLIGVFVMAFVLGIVWDQWEKDCVKRGFAEYNQTTGVWQWKEGR